MDIVSIYEHSFPLGDSIFGLTQCKHTPKGLRIHDFCLECTPCVICGFFITWSNYKRFTSVGVENVYAHRDCCKLGIEENAALTIDGTIAKFSFPLLNAKYLCHICKFITVDDVYINTKDDRIVSIHSRCLLSPACYVCGQFTNSNDLAGFITGEIIPDTNDRENFILEDKYVRHKTCVPPPCVFCKNGENVKFMQVGDSSWRFFYHDDCLKIQTCEFCKIKGGNFRHDGLMLRHVGGCSPLECILCKIVIGTSKHKLFGDKVSCHLDCLKDIKCSNCGTLAGANKLIYEMSLRHVSCSPDECIACNKVIGPDMFRNFGDNKLCHTKCLGDLICQYCGTRGGHFVYDGTTIKHISKCTREKCIVCDVVIGQTIYEKFTEDKICHMSCLKSLKCSNCKTAGSGKLVYDNNSIRHVDNCSPAICPICTTVISLAKKHELSDGKEYHRDCLDNEICYVCNIMGLGKKIKDFTYGFRHKKCNPEICVGCGNYIGKRTVRNIDGKIYHGIDRETKSCCGPMCKSCDKYNVDDTNTLKICEDGKYRHVTCINDECIVCLRPLGNPRGLRDISTIQIKLISVHAKCTFDCEKCHTINIDISQVKLRPIITEANKKTLPYRIKKTAVIILGIFKQKRTENIVDGVKTKIPTLPREIRKLIIELWLSGTVSNNLDCFPLVCDSQDNIILDARSICTKHRCIREKCVCGDILSWTLVPMYGCQKGICTNAVNALRDIMINILKKDRRPTWPISEISGQDEVQLEMLKTPSDNLSERQLLLYNIKIELIGNVIEKRKYLQARGEDEGY